MKNQSLCAMIVGISLSVLSCVSPSRSVHAGAVVAPDEAAEVLAAVDRVLEAMQARDTKAYAAAVAADGMTYTQKLIDEQWRLLRRTNQHHIDMLDDADDVLVETYWDPRVLIRGPIAAVWAPYEFRINDKVSHCGVDLFEMLKINGRWVMGNGMWTVEPDACSELKPRSGTSIRSRPARQ